VDVAAQTQEILIALNERGLEASLREMSGTLVAQVEVDREAGEQALHERGNIGARRLQ